MLENEEMLKALQEMNMFSDVFFKEIVRNIECACYVLKTVVSDVIVKESYVQKEISNPIGRGIRTDLLMEGIDDTKYNIEVQNEKNKFSPQRTRYHESLITCATTPKGTEFEDIKDVVIIVFFIDDPFGGKKEIYRSSIKMDEYNYDTGIKYMFVNGKTKSDSCIGNLVKDMWQKDPNWIESESLRKQAKYLKESEEGKRSMCAIMERFYNQGKNEGFEAGKIDGIKIGEANGIKIGQAEILIRQLIQKFGNISEKLKVMIKHSSIEELNKLAREIFIVKDEEDVIKILI